MAMCDKSDRKASEASFQSMVLIFILFISMEWSVSAQVNTTAAVTEFTETAAIEGHFYLNQSLSVGQTIKIVADGFTRDPESSSTLYTITLYANPSPLYPTETRVVMYFQVKEYGVVIKSNYNSVYHNDYLLDKDMYLSSDPDEPIRLEFKLTSSKWEFYYQGSRMPAYDWQKVLIGPQFLVNPIISRENTAGIDFSVDINSAEFIVTTVIFFILSLTANAVTFYFFYWKHRSAPSESSEPNETNETNENETKETSETSETLEAPAFDPYLQEIVVPLSLLIEDMLALSFEDPGKSMTINVAVVVIIQFICLMVVSWCRECLVFSVQTKRIGSLLVIVIEYTFGVILISLSRSPVLAGFTIGTLTALQIVAEIISMIFVKHTDVCFCIPSACRFFAPKSLDPNLSNAERLTAMAVGCLQEGAARTMILVSVFHIIFFAAGCVYIETGDGCYGEWFKYWWVFGMFLFSKIMESKFDSTDTKKKWEKNLLRAHFVALELFIVITTIVSSEITKHAGEECEAMPVFVYAGMVMIVWIILFGAAILYIKCKK